MLQNANWDALFGWMDAGLASPWVVVALMLTVAFVMRRLLYYWHLWSLKFVIVAALLVAVNYSLFGLGIITEFAAVRVIGRLSVMVLGFGLLLLGLEALSQIVDGRKTDGDGNRRID